jgi:hypothetical protein
MITARTPLVLIFGGVLVLRFGLLMQFIYYYFFEIDVILLEAHEKAVRVTDYWHAKIANCLDG